MIGRVIACVLLLAGIASANDAARSMLLAWFPDGAGVELYTDCGGSKVETSLRGAGMITFDRVYRMVEDKDNRPVFGYELQAEKGNEVGSVNIRIVPLTPEVQEQLHGRGRAAANVPTVAAPRVFMAVKRGQEVRLDMLSNPSTGERVYDVLRPTDQPKPYAGGPMISGMPLPPRKAPASDVQLVVNGQALAVQSSWSAGKLARLYLPGHGAYFLSWKPKPGFRMSGYVEKNRLIFFLDAQYVEITCAADILPGTDSGPVWISHDATLRLPAVTTAELINAGEGDGSAGGK